MRHVCASMVGRHAELSELRRLVAGASRGRPGLVFVTGDAGIGKTRLVEALLAEVGGGNTLVLRGHCMAEASRDVPLAPFGEALGDLHRSLDDDELALLAQSSAEPLSRLVPAFGVRPGDAAGEPSRAQMFTAVVEVFRRAARRRLVLLVVEDAHWADESSRVLLDYLARSLRDERLAVLVTLRSDDPGFERSSELLADLTSVARVSSIDLPPLSPGEVAEQVAGLRDGAPVPEARLERIVEDSRGVPLLVEELVDTDAEDVGAVADRLFGHRLSRLGPAARTVVDTLAVAVHDPTDTELAIASALPPGEFDDALSEAVSGGVLMSRGGTVTFRHALLRDATLTRLRPEARTRLHRHWSAVVTEDPVDLGRTVAAVQHLVESGQTAPALETCFRAAELARRISAYPERLTLLQRVVALWGRVPDAAQRTGVDLSTVFGEAAEAATLTGRTEESRRLVDRARAALPAEAPPARRAALALLWHRTRLHDDDRLTTDEVLRVAAEIPQRPPSRERVLACVAAAEALFQDADPRRGESWAAEAVTVARALADTGQEARSLAELARVRSARGDDAAAVRTAEQAVHLAEQSGDLDVLQHTLALLGIVQWTAGDPPDDAVDRRRVEILGGDEPGPLPGAWGMASANLAEGLLDAGRWDEAAQVLSRTLAVELPDHAFWSAQRLAEHLAVWRTGSFTRSPDMRACPRRRTLADTDLEDLLAVGYTYGEAAAYRGDLGQARCRMHAVLAEDGATANPGFLFQLLLVAARTEADARQAAPGPPDDEGRWIVERVEHLLDLMPPRNTRDSAYAAHARAELDRWAGRDTPDEWVRVVDLWRRTPMPHPLGWALMRAGEELARAARRTEARRALAEAVEIGQRLGAAPLVDRALAAGRRANLRLPATAPGATADLGLTPRELDVLRLIAEGASNATISETLVISPKTVSVHVSHILAKLGVTSRGEAAALAHRAALGHGQLGHLVR